MEYPKAFSGGPVRGPMPDFRGPGGGHGGFDFDDMIDRFDRQQRDRDRLDRALDYDEWKNRRRRRGLLPQVPIAPKYPQKVPPWFKKPWQLLKPDPFSWLLPDPFEYIPGARYPGGHLVPGDWTLLFNCHAWVPLTYNCSAEGARALRKAFDSSSLMCITGQAWGGGLTRLEGEPIPADWFYLAMANNHGPSSLPCLRWKEAGRFARRRSGIIPAPQIKPGPWWIPNPRHPDSGPIPGPSPILDPDPSPPPVEGGPAPERGKGPGGGTGPGRSRRPGGGIERPWRGRRPPKAGEKERKFRITVSDTRIGRMLSWAFGQVTEYSELIDCLWDNLPSKVKREFLRPKRLPDGSPYADDQWCVWDDKRGEWRCGIGNREPGIDVKARALYKHYKSVDVGNAITCVIANALEDSALGKLGKISQEAAIKHGRPVSWDFGPAL